MNVIDILIEETWIEFKAYSLKDLKNNGKFKYLFLKQSHLDFVNQ